jgi:hypothetical protein
MLTNVRACASCGSVAFGLEPCAAQYRTVQRKPQINDRALALSPVVREFGLVNAHRVSVCPACKIAPEKFGAFVPNMSPDYAADIATLPFVQLHEMCFLDVHFKLTTHAKGYVSGEFCDNSLIHGPILAGVPCDPTEHTAAWYNVWDKLTTSNGLYQDYVPLMCRSMHHSIQLPPDTWQHITANARLRDPVTDRHDDFDLQTAVLEVYPTNGLVSRFGHAAFCPRQVYKTGSTLPHHACRCPRKP